MKFRTNITVDIHDVDYNGVARLTSLMQYVQSCAQAQLTYNGMSYEQLRNMHRAFIISKVKLEFDETIRAYDNLEAVSYPCDSRGYSFLRCYALEKDGRTVGRAVSIWALIDTETHSLVRVNNFELGLTTHEPHSLSLSRFSLPQELCEVGRYEVRYQDVDQNMHMNNTAYPNMYSNYLPLDNRRIKSISINYVNEAKMGTTLIVQKYQADKDLFYFRTLCEDGRINTEAEIVLCDID